MDYEHCVLTIAALARSTLQILHQPQIISLKRTSLLRLHAASYCQKQVIEATKSQERREDEKQSDTKKRGQNKEMSAEGENGDQRSPPSSSSPPEAVKKEKNNKNTVVPAGATNETKIQLICTQTMDVNGSRGVDPSPSKSMEEHKESLSPALISKLENFLQRKVDIDGGNLFKHRQRRNVMSHHSFSILLTSLTIITFLLLKFSFIIEKLNLSGSQYSSCVSNLKNNIFI